MKWDYFSGAWFNRVTLGYPLVEGILMAESDSLWGKIPQEGNIYTLYSRIISRLCCLVVTQGLNIGDEAMNEDKFPPARDSFTRPTQSQFENLNNNSILYPRIYLKAWSGLIRRIPRMLFGSYVHVRFLDN